MSGFHFLRPEWFWVLVPLAALFVAMFNRSWQKTPWSKVVDAHLLPHLLVGKRDGKPVWPLIFLGSGWVLSVLVLAGPSWSEKPALKFRSDASPWLPSWISPILCKRLTSRRPDWLRQKMNSGLWLQGCRPAPWVWSFILAQPMPLRR